MVIEETCASICVGLEDRVKQFQAELAGLKYVSRTSSALSHLLCYFGTLKWMEYYLVADFIALFV